ncbi:MAG: glycine--tRNA ligase subunit beta [Deltaproteobacteria bacterium]|nr:glycine--tRNA ligase subunit beta [Deltaproteobacteria bacterium]
MASALLLEIGCEELPTSFLDHGLDQLRTLLPEALSQAHLPHGELKVHGTPRRLAALVESVADEAPAREEELLGPPEGAARTPDGRWSKAAEGFARKCDLPVDALTLADTPKGRYLRAVKHHPGAPASALLPEVLGAVCRRLTFAKSMRWGDGDTAFGRPVRWLLGLHGTHVVPFSFAGLQSGRETYGHRFLHPGAVSVPHPSEYLSVLEGVKVLADAGVRRERMVAALRRVVEAEGGVLVPDAFLEREVLGLVEWPHALLGRFEEAFLALPEALITSVMRGHQRYFAARGERHGELLPVFVTVCNTAEEPGVIRQGNERVLRARLKDASFFQAQDRKVPLAERVPSLDGVTFHAKLGSYGDKARRLGALCAWLASRAPGVDSSEARLAGTLAKADLVTLTVGEFPELEGTLGGVQARHDGLPEAVASAVETHYQPRGASDSPPEGALGAVLALADRVDTLVGCFAAGLRPSGSEDPFGLRRAVLGALRVVLRHRLRVGFGELVSQALQGFTEPELTRTARARETVAGASEAELTEAVREFAAERLRGLLEASHPRDVVSACMGARRDEPLDVQERAEALGAFWATPPAQDLAVAFKRVFNITREAPAGEPDRALLTAPAEVELLARWDEAREELRGLLAARSYGAALELLARSLRAPVDRFFTEVFVMDPDPAVRDARLRLLGRIADAAAGIARFDALSELQGS